MIDVRYAVGDGVLVGSGHRWLLLAEDPGARVLDEVYASMLGRGPVVEGVLELLEKHWPTALPSLVLVDLAPSATESATRGEGRLVHDGDRRLLTVGIPGEAAALRVVGGVVRAARAELREVAAPSALARLPGTGGAPRGQDPARPLISTIPPHILAASAPERRPDPARLAAVIRGHSLERSRATQDPPPGWGPREAVLPDHLPVAPAPVVPIAPAPIDDPRALGGGRDEDHDGHTTFRGGPGGERPAATGERVSLEPGGHTSFRPQPPHSAAPAHGGLSDAAPGHLRHSALESVLAVHCPAGHLTAAFEPSCRVCRTPVGEQEPHRIPRPRLGVLRLPTGEVVPLDRGVVLGRKPAPIAGGEPWPHVVHLPSDSTFLSRVHLQIELDGWLVLARDLGSAGGTRLHVPGREPELLRAHEAYVLEHGHTLDLADVYSVTFAVTE